MRIVSTAVASLSVAIACAALALKLELAPTYPDFIVGHITWRAASKLQDLVCVPVFVLAFGLAFGFLDKVAARLHASTRTSGADAFADQLIFWSIPCLVVMGRVAGSSPFEYAPAAVSALGVTLVAAAGAGRNLHGGQCPPQVFGVALFALLLLALLPFEYALVAGRIAGSQVGGFGANECGVVAAWVGGCGAVGLTTLAIFRPAHLPGLTRRLVAWSQLGLPFLFVVLYPARLKPTNGAAIEFPATLALRALVVALVVWGLVDILRRNSRTAFDPRAPWRGFSPVALVALAVALKIGNTVTPFISADDYHFGESLLGVWSYAGGALPYVDYVPPHGLVDDDLPGLVSRLFYDGTAATFHESVRLSHGLLAIVAYLSLHALTGSLALPFASIMFLDGRLGWFFLAPFICLWLAPSWREHPQRWLIQWLVSAPIVFLGVPPQGSLLIAASSLIAFACAFKLASGRAYRAWLAIGSTAAIGIAIFMMTPLASMAAGATRYMIENGPINQVAYGIPWSLSWATPPQPHVLLELIRMSWIAVPLVCVGLMTSGRGAGATPASRYLPAIVVFVFTLLLIPYAMGRIDPDRVSTRAGVFAILGWTVLLPVILWPVLRAGNRAAFVATIALCGALLNFRPVAPAAMAAAVAAEINAGTLNSGPAAGMPNLGIAAVQDSHWERLLRVKSTLDAHLAPGETYLDLSNRVAQYFYFDRKPPTPIAAPFNMAAPAQQIAALKLLNARPPSVALVEADSIGLEDGRLALRAPLLYRFVVLNYTPVAENGLVLALHRSRPARPMDLAFESTVRKITDENWIDGIHRKDTAIVVDNPAFAASVPAGTPVRFPNGEVRRVSRVWKEGSAVWFEGPRLSPGAIGSQGLVSARLSSEESRLTLFERAFSHADLAGIPIAWGRSARTLLDHTKLVRRLDALGSGAGAVDSKDRVRFTSVADPGLTLDLAGVELSGREAGLLKFEFRCSGKKAAPRLRLSWWGNDEAGPADLSKLIFDTDDGTLIVPVDSSPRWLLLDRIRGIRISLENPGACSAIGLANIELRQRNGYD